MLQISDNYTGASARWIQMLDYNRATPKIPYQSLAVLY